MTVCQQLDWACGIVHRPVLVDDENVEVVLLGTWHFEFDPLLLEILGDKYTRKESDPKPAALTV